LSLVERDVRGYWIVGKSARLCNSILTADVYMPCQHRCVYCYVEALKYVYSAARIDPAKEIAVFRTLPERLERFFSVHRELRFPIRFGALSDVGPPYEVTAPIFARCLEAALRHEYPVMVITKVPLHEFERIPDLILKMADRGLISVAVTITSFDEAFYRRLEPRAPSAERRAEFLQWLRDHGLVPVLRVSPLFQGVTDTEEAFREILERCPRGHVVAEYVRIRSRVLRGLLEGLGCWPWAWDHDIKYYMAPREYRAEGYRRVREVAHRLGWSFAVCGDHAYKVTDYRDCCSGPTDLYGKFMPYRDSPKFDRDIREGLIPAIPLMPISRWRGPDHDLSRE
jgi:DNA repair photolyase